MTISRSFSTQVGSWGLKTDLSGAYLAYTDPHCLEEELVEAGGLFRRCREAMGQGGLHGRPQPHRSPHLPWFFHGGGGGGDGACDLQLRGWCTGLVTNSTFSVCLLLTRDLPGKCPGFLRL